MADNRKRHVRWGFGHWDFDYLVSDSEGLSLLSGRYRGVPIFGKFSMPVIRVKYLVDGGWHDWRREKKTGAGPYADQIRWHLGGDHGLQSFTVGSEDYVKLIEFLVKGVRWLEMGVYARIGHYHIYQAWYLNEEGIVQPYVWSKGLTIKMDHTHHPYWRLDFDIDGRDHNRVWRFDDGQGWRFYRREANDAKNTRTHTAWFVRNERTFNGAWVLPGHNDGNPDGFSGIDMAVRLYRQDQDVGWPFGANGIGFSKGEPVDDNDVVFWYVAHLFHHFREGGSAWHGAGPTIRVVVPPPPPLPPNFRIDVVKKRRDEFGGEVTVTGTGFTPGGPVQLSYLNVPHRVGVVSAGAIITADGNGKFTNTDHFDCVHSRNPDDAFLEVEVDALDVNSGLIAKTYTSATIWVC